MAALRAVAAAVAVAVPSSVAGVLEKGSFRLTWDDHGITGIANPMDPHGAAMIAPGQRLDLAVKFRTGDKGEWRDLASPPSRFEAGAPASFLCLRANAGADDQPLRATQSFQADGAVLDWRIELENTGATALEVGDLAIRIPVPGPGGSEPSEIFERGFLRHQFIAGHGSFLYFARASGAPPFLVVTPLPGTWLEYSGRAAGGNRGAAHVFVHSACSGGGETRGTWRQKHSSAKLAASGSPAASARYGFRFQWAESHDAIRDILHKEGLFDIRAVPGMTIPVDLTANFSLRTKARIESIDAEFPAQTTIIPLRGPDPDHHVYQVAFKRLGENKLTIRHDGGRHTLLEYFVTEPLETVIKKRSAFITGRQQIRDPSKWWNGVYGPYDMREKVVRTIDDPDIFLDRMVYVLTCDDPGLCKAPYVAAKNVSFPDVGEIRSIEYYLEHFVWGKLQRTDKEHPYPYGVYGTPNWHVGRDMARRRELAEKSGDERSLRDLQKEHVWRSYDYPHIVMLYFHMYEISKLYPSLSRYLDAKGYLERAFQTARAFFIYPYQLYPTYYETYKWGLYNELVVLNLIDALGREGRAGDAAWLRAEWEKKVKYFVYDDPYPYRSEYPFDRTAFESSHALAKYGATNEMKPDKDLWYDIRLKKWYSHPVVKREDSRAFMERQLAAGLAVRGWLEASYYQLGSDLNMSYMAAMGGWSVLDYALHFASKPSDWLQLGYASYLSSWCLVNSGPPESGHGFWFPGKENDGAAGWQFSSAKVGNAWMGSSYPGGVLVPRGPWHYDGEIDLGFGAALRMASTVVTRDPVFGWFAYGGVLEENGDGFSVVPRDGLRRRLCVVPEEPEGEGAERLFKVEFERDGFAREKPILFDPAMSKVTFTVENRSGEAHDTRLRLSFPANQPMVVLLEGRRLELRRDGDQDHPWSTTLPIKGPSATVELVGKGR